LVRIRLLDQDDAVFQWQGLEVAVMGVFDSHAGFWNQAVGLMKSNTGRVAALNHSG
jgi:hypothetical protein